MRLTVGQRQVDCRPGETVLQALARNGIKLPVACGSGICQACVVRAVRGDPGRGSQAGLRAAMASEGYFLACVARPERDLTVAITANEVYVPATLESVAPLSAGVLRVLVRPAAPLVFLAGQHVALQRRGGVTRLYSIANLPSEAAHGIEMHVRVFPGGAMSGWLAQAAAGSPLRLGLPSGDCCYLPGDQDAPLLLAGTGTGIAPLAAIARDALAQGHRGPVVLVQGAAEPGGLYLSKLARSPGWPPGIRVRTCALSAGQRITDAVLQELEAFPRAASVSAYLCGGVQAVAAMRRLLFLAGLSLRRIHVDSFTPAAG
jgi:CDP-4-dehydro-6-deoxyglucose reductase, E3